MRMQAIPVVAAPNGNPNGVVVQTPQPIYIQSNSNSPSGTPYHEYEFIEQAAPSPSPQQTFEQSYAAPQQVEGKSSYPEVRAPTSVMAQRQEPQPQQTVRRYIRVERPSMEVRNAPRRDWAFGILGFFRKLLHDDEGLSVEKAIIDENRRIAEAEEAIEADQSQVDRQERREAWERIEKLTDNQTKVAAVQAEIQRSANHWTQASERRTERARQRDNARDELDRYRSQRAKVRVLEALAYSATALFIFRTIWCSIAPHGCTPPGKGNQKVFVAKNNSQGNQSVSQPPQQPASMANSERRRPCW